MPDRRRRKTYTVHSPFSGTVESLKWTGLVASLPTASALFHNFVATVVVDNILDHTFRCKRLANGNYEWVEDITDRASFLDFGTREVAFGP